MKNYTDCRGKKRYRLQKNVGKKLNKQGEWVKDIRSFYGKSRREAEEKYIAFLTNRKAPQFNPQTNCLGEIIDIWANSVFKQMEIANSTKKKYLSVYERVFRPSFIAGQPIANVTALDIQSLYNEINECYSTRRALHNFLRMFYQYAEVTNLAMDITRSLVVKRDKRVNHNFDIDVWDDKDLKKVIASLQGNLYRLLVVLAVNTGARFSELLALTYDDITDGMLSINKQVSEIAAVDSEDDTILHLESVKSEASNRVIPLAENVLEEIEKHRALQIEDIKKWGYDNKGLLFCTKHGTMLYKRNVMRTLQRHYQKIGVPYHKFHSFRHTFATNLSRQNVSLEEIAKLMGHSDMEMSRKYYIHIDAMRRKSAVEKIVQYSLKG